MVSVFATSVYGRCLPTENAVRELGHRIPGGLPTEIPGDKHSYIFSPYAKYVKSHEKELECHLLKVYKYFRKVGNPDSAILERAKKIPALLYYHELATSGALQADYEKLVFKGDCHVRQPGGPACIVAGCDDAYEDKEWCDFVRENAINTVSVLPKFSDEEILEFLKGYSKYRWAGLFASSLDGHSDWRKKEDCVAGIELYQDSMVCAPLISVEVESAIDRIIEILEEAQEYCEKEKTFMKDGIVL